MSISIEGYKLPKVKTTEDLFALVSSLKKSIKKEQVTHLKEVFVKECLKMYDWHEFHKNDFVYFSKGTSYSDTSSIASCVTRKLKEEQKERRENDQMEDFYFHLHVFFFNKEFYVVPRSRDDRYIKVFKKVCNAEDFRYWNATDGPKGISEKEWKQRLDTWEQVFEKKYVLSEAPGSLKVECPFEVGLELGDFYYEPHSFFKREVSNVEGRFSDLAHSVAISKMRQLGKVPDKFDMVQFMQMLRDDLYLEILSKIKDELKNSFSSDVDFSTVMKKKVTILKEHPNVKKPSEEKENIYYSL